MSKRITFIWEHNAWPSFTWDDSLLISPLGECRLTQGKLLSRVNALGISISTEARAEILSVEALKTSEIEGEKLDVGSLRSSVSRRLGLSHAGFAPDKRIEGLLDILIDATENYTTPLSDKRIRGWHTALFPSGYSGFTEITVGNYRKGPMKVISGRAGHEKIHFEAPPSESLKKEMPRFFLWWNNSYMKEEGIIRAALTHLYFVTLHPFDDGNGRIARALTDMALAQDDKQPVRYYSLSRQIMEERKDYYAILEKTQRGNLDITEWLVWFLGCFTRSIIRSEEILSNVFMRAEFSKRDDVLSLSERQRSVLLRVLESGFEGGLNTRKYMALAKVSRATAFRELDELYSLGFLRRTGKGRSAGYEIVK
jgi:Fic family protein